MILTMMLINRLCVFCCCSVLSLWLITPVASQFANRVGDSCALKSGGRGVCTAFEDCNLELLKNEGPQPNVCAWGEDAILCCPTQSGSNTAPSRSTSTQLRSTKSYQKCLEYGRRRCHDGVTTTIVNGIRVTSPEEFPHMVLLGYGDARNPAWKCGGSLISEQYVLTAAHCLRSREQLEPTVAALGFLNRQTRQRSSTYQERRIAQVIPHPNRMPPQTYNDIALLKLDRPVDFTRSVFPACLHEENTISMRNAQATGWGDLYTSSNAGSDDLMKVKLQITNHAECSRLYPTNRKLRDGIREHEQFCAGGDNKDTCQGDSGGPLQIYRTDDLYCMQNIIGVTSFGVDCGKQPGVFTRVSNYIPWIESIVWP